MANPFDVRYQQYGNIGRGFGGLMQVLAQMAEKQRLIKEADDYFSGGVADAPTLKPNFGSQGTPIGEGFNPNNVPVQPRASVPNAIMQEPSIAQRASNPQTLLRGLMSVNPEIQRRSQAGIQGIQLTQPKYQEFSAGSENEQINPFNTTAPKRISVAPKPLVHKKIGEATVGGRKVATMARPDGTNYTVDLGESFEGTRLGLAKANLEIARQRLDKSLDKDVKSEGKYLLKQWDNAEKQYNKNAMYLSDPNLPESTRNVILTEQDGLVQEMLGYTKSIEELGQNVNEVIAPPKPKFPPKVKPKLF